MTESFSRHLPVLRRMRFAVAGINHRTARQEKAALDWAMREAERLEQLRSMLAGSGTTRPGT